MKVDPFGKACPRVRRVDGRYTNPYLKSAKRSIYDFLLLQLGYYNDDISLPKPPESFTYPNPKEPHSAEEPHVVWVNHSTFYLSCDGCNILTDPIWSTRCSPFSFIGPKRVHNPGIELDMLPPIHFVLISHNHYDHLDVSTVMEIRRKNPDCIWVVPTGVKEWFTRKRIENVIELSWWESTDLSLSSFQMELHITAVPTQHFSGRGLFDRDQTLWAGYVVDFTRKRKPAKRLYFCGDSGYNQYDFKQIGERFGGMDLSLIPVGTYVPSAFMQTVHMNPKQATAVHQDVRSKLSVGMHWKTFRLSMEPSDQPPYDLYLSMKEAGLDPLCFRILEPGQVINW